MLINARMETANETNLFRCFLHSRCIVVAVVNLNGQLQKHLHIQLCDSEVMAMVGCCSAVGLIVVIVTSAADAELAKCITVNLLCWVRG